MNPAELLRQVEAEQKKTLEQKNRAEAGEKLALESYEGLKQNEATIKQNIPARDNVAVIARALDRLINLYTATNKPDDVAKWQAERAKYPAPAQAEKK